MALHFGENGVRRRERSLCRHHQQRAFARRIERARVSVEPERVDSLGRGHARNLGTSVSTDRQHRPAHRHIEFVILRVVDQAGWLRSVQREAVHNLQLRIQCHDLMLVLNRNEDCSVIAKRQTARHAAEINFGDILFRPHIKLR